MASWSRNITRHPASGSGNPGPDGFQDALLDSRQRWRDLATIAADFSFETDRRGCFTFINPDPALGWPAATLVGQPAEMLLLRTEGVWDGFNPFRLASSVCRRRVRLKRADGSAEVLSLTACPLRDATAEVVGVRGAAIDYVEHTRYPARIASHVRRGQLLEYILQRCREARSGSNVISVVTSLVMAAGADGAMLIDVASGAAEPDFLFQLDDPPAGLLDGAAAQTFVERDLIEASGPAGQPFLFTKCGSIANGNIIGLALWREAGATKWHQDDRWLPRVVAGIISVARSGITRSQGSVRSCLEDDRRSSSVSLPKELVPAVSRQSVGNTITG
jgi:PAS domain S-box-containing protein